MNILFTKEDIAPILHELMGHEVKEFNMKIKEQEYVLHISKLSSIEKSDGVIICVELAPSLLNKNEKLGLENSMNLLKNRLFYD